MTTRRPRLDTQVRLCNFPPYAIIPPTYVVDSDLFQFSIHSRRFLF